MCAVKKVVDPYSTNFAAWGGISPLALDFFCLPHQISSIHVAFTYAVHHSLMDRVLEAVARLCCMEVLASACHNRLPNDGRGTNCAKHRNTTMIDRMECPMQIVLRVTCNHTAVSLWSEPRYHFCASWSLLSGTRLMPIYAHISSLLTRIQPFHYY